MTRIEEKQLVLPALFFLNLEWNNWLETSNLIPKLRNILKPSWEDTTILLWRGDDKFSQIVRNLKSHNTLTNSGYANYSNNKFIITDEWKRYLQENIEIVEYLINNDFDWEELKKWLEDIYIQTNNWKKVQYFDENIIISEWIKKVINVNIYERSTKLRNIAIEYFKKPDWKLYCECCSFNFDSFYGENIAKNYIEIHHKKPIYQFEWDDFEANVTESLNNLSPICANCHRMIHRSRINMLDIEFLTNTVNSIRT